MFLKQSAAAVLPVGPFVSKDDGVTEVTDLPTPTGRLYKNDTPAAFTPASWSHDADGVYLVGLSAADTDTVGRLRLAFADPTVHLPVWRDLAVLDPDAFDSLVGDRPLGAWSDGEQQQMRRALGLAGENAETTGNGILDAVQTRVQTLLGIPVLANPAVTGTQQDITRYRGDTAPLAFDLGRDITAAALAFTVKRRAKDPQSAALITKTSADPAEIEILSAADGQLHVHLAAADTADLIPCGRRATFVYDLEMTLDTTIETVAAGQLILLPDVTTP